MRRALALALLLAGCGERAVVKSPTARALSPRPPGCEAPIDPAIAFAGGELLQVCRGVYADPAVASDEADRLRRYAVEARKRVADQMGPLRSDPVPVLFCKTDPCRLYFAGVHKRSYVIERGHHLEGAAFIAPRTTIVIVRIDETAEKVLVHETAHIEIADRLKHSFVPAWFNEGIAVELSGEPACEGQSPTGIEDLRWLARNDDWANFTNLPGRLQPTYCQARAEVGAWWKAVGIAGLTDLLGAIADGKSFAEHYGPMRTQSSAALPTVLTSLVEGLGDHRKPFSFALWVKPASPRGVLVHVSSSIAGFGWCTPFLGFDRSGRLVAQVIHGNGPDPANYAIALDPAPLPPQRWTHVAMTWAPGGFNRLYVGGVKVAEIAAPDFNTRHAPPGLMTVAWGSSNLAGGFDSTCWQGAIVPGRFDGLVTAMAAYDVELGASEVATLAANAP